jgi:hypothetical protein
VNRKLITILGDTLETQMWKVKSTNGVDEIIFQTIVKEDGRVALYVQVTDNPNPIRISIY